MKIVLIITFSLLLNTPILMAQRNSPGTIRASGSPLDRDAVLKWLNDAENSKSSKSNQSLDVSSIEGSPYYYEEFIPGKIYYVN